MLRIDGSFGEGGGQILRSALTLAVVTGREVGIENIRAGRRPPGLRPQHLKAVQGCVAICGARVEGARPGSTRLSFWPGAVRAGRYRLDVGTAGAVSLIFQTLFLPLAFAAGPSQLSLRGGTHVPWSPSFHYLERQFLPATRRLGLQAGLRLPRAGFYPQGGGLMEVEIAAANRLSPLVVTAPGPLQRIDGLSVVAGLDLEIARRQARRAQEVLAPLGVPVNLPEALLPSVGKGTMLLLQAHFAAGSSCHFALGARGKPAERVAEEAAEELLRTLAAGAPMDEHLADQLLLPLAFCPGRSCFRTPRVTGHLLTNAWVIRQFLPVAIRIDGEEGAVGEVVIHGVDRHTR